MCRACPAGKVTPEHYGEAESFLLWLLADEERLADTFGVGEGWSWHCALMEALCRVIRLQADKYPDAIRRRVTELILMPGFNFHRSVSLSGSLS
ncbi:TPA: hypothetical protein JG914_004726 [Enterobacter hormaechei subsp. steigerwaltii]|nr:hypothetical protein [Enterobacter hormaechei subsp. steigerwaltii]